MSDAALWRDKSFEEQLATGLATRHAAIGCVFRSRPSRLVLLAIRAQLVNTETAHGAAAWLEQLIACLSLCSLLRQ